MTDGPTQPAARTLVFVSYAREDGEFCEQLIAHLDERGIDTWVDGDDIAPGVLWRGEIDHGIERSGALVAVVSPHSAGSEECAKEVRLAHQLGKPIVPVVAVFCEPERTIDEIRDRNWIFWRSDAEREGALGEIDEALTVDPVWAKEHARLLGATLEWERHDRDRSRLLRGDALTAAESALTVDRPPSGRGKREQPQPTNAMREFVRAGRLAATSRQRRTAAIALGVAAVSIALALVAFAQFREASTQRDRAEEQLRVATSRTLAAQAIQHDAFGTGTTGLLLAAEAAARSPTAEARDALLTLLPADAIVTLRSPERPDAAVQRVVSADDRFEVSNDGRTLRDLDTGRTQTLIDDPDPYAVFLRDVVFSPDSSRLALTNLGERRFEVYDLRGGLPAPLLHGTSPPPGERVFAAVLDRQNALIGVSVFGGGDDPTGLTVSVWDEGGAGLLEATVEGELPPDLDLIEALVRISADDDIGAIVTQWGEAQLFSTQTAQLIGDVLPVECSPGCGVDAFVDARLTTALLNASELRTVDALGDARTFALDIERWIRLACEAADDRLTPAQWERFVGDDVAYDPVC